MTRLYRSSLALIVVGLVVMVLAVFANSLPLASCGGVVLGIATGWLMLHQALRDVLTGPPGPQGPPGPMGPIGDLPASYYHERETAPPRSRLEGPPDA